MNRTYFHWRLMVTLILPSVALAQSNISTNTAALNDQVTAQLSSSVVTWTAMEASELVADGAFNEPTVAADIKLHFKDQPLGAPEIKALELVTLVRAVKLAENSVKSVRAQITAANQARINALIAQSGTPKSEGPRKLISLNTQPNRTVMVGGGQPSAVMTTDPQIVNLLQQRLQNAQAALGRLSEGLITIETQAATIGDARLAGLK